LHNQATTGDAQLEAGAQSEYVVMRTMQAFRVDAGGVARSIRLAQAGFGNWFREVVRPSGIAEALHVARPLWTSKASRLVPMLKQRL
jgi:hypothetical protein